LSSPDFVDSKKLRSFAFLVKKELEFSSISTILSSQSFPMEQGCRNMAKRHGWLTGALADKGYQQHDLARAWKVDAAVVSRFISSGKPDLTPQRQMILSQILGLSNDQLLVRLYGDGPSLPRVFKPSSPANPNSGGIEQAHAEIRRAIEHLQELMPDATVTVTITYRGQ
jgi:hypothetical protein